MTLPVRPPVEPMLAQLAHEVPEGDFLYEPKWDGFRSIVFRDGDEIHLASRNGRPLDRYFPELSTALLERLPPRIVVDGEVVIAGPGGLDFEALLMRIHPAASRVEKLARETPSSFIAFDLLALGDRDLRPLPFAERRAALLEALAGAEPPLHVTPATDDPALAHDWFHRFEAAGLDGVVAKPRGLPYVPGERVMTKVKHQRTADCVVGGTRTGKNGGLGSLLLGLYDEDGRLHHVGVASGLSAAVRRQLDPVLAPLREGATRGHPWLADRAEEQGTRIPGGPSRWTGGRDTSWEPVRPELVVEVAFDHGQGDRFRHATRFVRLRPDRDPRSASIEQLRGERGMGLEAVLAAQPAQPAPSPPGSRRPGA